MNFKLLNGIRDIKLDKKYLPLLLFLTGVLVFGSVAINQLYFGEKYDSTQETSHKQATPASEEVGEVAGVKEESEKISPTTTTIKKQSTPANKPEVKSDSNEQNNNSNTNSNNNSNNTSTVVVVTATPVPTNTPIPTNTPTPIPPTSIPDKLTADLSVQRNDKGEIVSASVTANKPSTFVWKLSIYEGNEMDISPNPKIENEYYSSGSFNIGWYDECLKRGISCDIKLIVYVTSGSETIRLST